MFSLLVHIVLQVILFIVLYVYTAGIVLQSCMYCVIVLYVHILQAYSLYDREVGYCQGSAFIVGLLLMLMPEEETFSVVIQMMVDYRMRELFKPSMAELGICMYQLEYLIQEHSPALYQHFQAQSFHTSMYASGWFLTLYTTQLPLDLCFRIMDVFLLEVKQNIHGVVFLYLYLC